MTGPQDAGADGQRLLEQARAAAERGEYEMASALYARLMGHPDPNIHVAGLLGLADSRYRLDDEEGALQAWITATQAPETPLTWQAWVALAGARVRQGDLPGATRSYREAARRAPPDEQPAIASRLGWLNKEMGSQGTAERYFRRARTGVFTPVATYVVLAITVAISLFVDYGGLLGNQLGNLLLLDKEAVMNGEYWRLFTVTLVHGGLLHLGFNMYALYIVGPVVEMLYGRILFVVFYLLAAAGGSIASYLVFPNPAVGASGAIFGLFGLLFVSTYIHKPLIGQQARLITRQIGMLIVVNLVIGFGIGAVASIDNAAHIGGLLAGAWLGFTIVPRGTATLRSLWQGLPPESSRFRDRHATLLRSLASPASLPFLLRPFSWFSRSGRSASGRNESMRFMGETVMQRSVFNVLFGTFTLRFSTALTGGLLAYYLGNLQNHGGAEVTAFAFAIVHAAFYATELIVSPVFGLLSDRLGHHRVMQFGPIFGAVAVTITALTTNLIVLGGTRVLEGAATAASIPSILGFLALATSANEELRGKVSARFELATLAGLGAGVGAAGIFWELFHAAAFFVNAGFYMVSYAIYRFGVAAPDASAGPHHRPEYGWHRYGTLLRTSHIWLLAPTWIALNAAIGVYAGTGLFNLVRDESEKFPNQVLAGGLSTLEITLGLAAVGVIFVAGLIYWGNRFKNTRRTTIIFYGIAGGAALVVAAIAFNHSGGAELILRLPLAVVAAIGLFLLAGATPAALGLLADMSEAYPDDRGAVMGLYGVFLALGQIVGNLVGGWAADRAGFDGVFIATLVFVAIAVLPLFWLRRYEDQFEAGPTGATA